MSKETVDVIVDGGKASAGAAMGKAFGPLGVNLQAILAEINEKTKDFVGMKVPVKVIVETEDKSFEIEVGSPSVSELIKTEINLKKGSGEQSNVKVGNLSIEQVIKISKMKIDSLLANNFKSAVKMVLGSCQSLGILVESKEAKEISREVEDGVYDKELNEEKTEADSEKIEKLADHFKQVQTKQTSFIKAKEAESKKAEEEKKEKEAKPEEKPEEKKKK